MPVEVVESKTSQTIDQQVAKIKQIEALKKELDKLKSKYRKEKQRNRQFEINREIKLKQQALDGLKAQ